MISTLMFIFSGAILFYALLLAWTKNIGLIMRSYAAEISNKKQYAVKFAKILASTAIAPAITGLTGLITENVLFLGIVFVVSFIVCIKIGITLFMKEEK
ncbi:MAG: hypothetical protein IJP96_05915 [Synergistaceae bacterium]|nr:hypothetical protein [Synergistaceae bacterium]